jgi:hypothetical protein
MGYVWYERSSDGGNSWIIMNGGKPLSTYPSKSPSIDYNGYSDLGTIGIVFQEDYPGSGGMIKYFPVRYSRDNYGNINYNSYALQDIIDLGDVSFSSFDASPVIAFGSTSPFFLVVWKGLEGLTAKYFDGNNSNVIVPKSAETVLYSVSDQTSEHPFLVSNKLGNSVFHLAWDQNTSTTSGTIRYCKLSAGTTVDVVGGSYNSNVSSGCGYSKNSMPSLIPASDNTVRISWLGSEIYDMTSSVFRGMFSDGTWNPRFWSFGSNVASQCINLGSDGYYILFSDYISGAYKNQFTDSRTLSNIYTLNTTGKYVQLNNDAGGTSRTMYGMSFYTDGLPYMFDRSYYSIGHYYGLNKSVPGKEAQVSGRGAILSKEGAAKFYFKIEDISVEGKSVGFINVPDTVKINGINELNGYLVTEPFVLQDTSSYTFRTIYGVSDSLAALKTLGKDGAVSFKVELLDNSNKVLSTLKDVSFSGSIPISKKFGSYKVNLKGIGKKQVRMKLTVENNMDLDLTTLDSYFTKQAQGLSGSLAKYETINIDGKEIVTEYSLNQNYPNPFNPVTRINYQIPKSAKVTLKVYDILGKEVATLVNDYKEIGKYSVDFNASALSSGVYIYELRANDFVKSGKMMLLK